MDQCADDMRTEEQIIHDQVAGLAHNRPLSLCLVPQDASLVAVHIACRHKKIENSAENTTRHLN